MRALFCFIILLTISACQKEIDLDQPYYEPKVVVDGYIESGNYAKVYLTLSSPYLTHYDSVSIRKSFLNYAKITLSSSKGEEEILTLFKEKSFFPPFVYKSISIKGATDVSYNLKVELAGRTITSTTTIPEPPDITDQRFNQKTDTTGIVEFALIPPAEENQYLFTRVKSTFSKENYHPAYIPTSKVSSNAPSPIWQQALRISESRGLSLNSKKNYYKDYPVFVYDLRDTISILPGTVDSTSYQVLESLFMDLNSQENPFKFNGNKIKTNIHGGIGRWTGIGIKRPIKVTGNNKSAF